MPVLPARRRPFLVAVIFWFHVLATFSVAWIFLRIVTGHTRLRTPLRPAMLLYAAASVVLISVKLWGAIALYRLRRSAVSIFLTAVLLNLPATIYDIYHHPRGYPLSSIFSIYAGVMLAAGTCVYAVYLQRIGMLE
jgi:hypothetical protein